jgi:hypothetical protein
MSSADAAGASAEAAAIAAAHMVLTAYFPGSAAALLAARESSLASIAAGQAKKDGIAIGESAARAMIRLRPVDGSDGSTPTLPAEAVYAPGAADPGLWQPTTPGCPTHPTTKLPGGALFHWRNVTPFGITDVAEFMPGPPPAMSSSAYRKDYDEVKSVGSSNSTRPQDRADVVLYYRDSSPTFLLDQAARQVSLAERDSLAENARGLALLNMAISDALVASFATKYRYILWRPETAIPAGGTDGNDRTVEDSGFRAFITTPCFPSYPSNHGSGTGAGVEMLRRLYGAGSHDIELTNPRWPDIKLPYSTFNQIADDVDDARVYGGIHFRFDQEAGGRLGREIATAVYKKNLRPRHGAN